MPIKGLSEKRRLCRLSKIHLGVKAISERTKKEYPKAVDYFVLPDDAIGKQIAEVFGERPKELDCVFPVDDRDQIFPAFYKMYRSGVGLFCKGDGETCDRIDEKTGAWREGLPCKGEECGKFKASKCRRMANLLFMIPQISLSGVFQIDTSSVNSIIDINSGLDAIETFAEKMMGERRLSYIPARLRVGKRTATVEGKKKNIFTMTLAVATWTEIESLGDRMKLLRQTLGGERVALPLPQQDKFEEGHLIPQSTQDGEEPPAEGPKAGRRPIGKPKDDEEPLGECAECQALCREDEMAKGPGGKLYCPDCVAAPPETIDEETGEIAEPTPEPEPEPEPADRGAPSGPPRGRATAGSRRSALSF